MRITKYNQACLLIDTNGIRILVDPGVIGYNDSLLDEWSNIDLILVTHKHMDHFNKEAILEIIKRDKASLYTTKEVIDEYSLKDVIEVKVGDIINFKNIKIEVTKAIHGYLYGMRENNIEITYNVGYIMDDAKTRLYITSDTIGFYNTYKCDILCMPFNGNGLTLGLVDGVSFIKGINPKIVLPIHTEHPNPIMNPNIKNLKETLEKNNLNYKILDLKETFTYNE